MSVARFIPSLLLAIALGVAPVLHGLAKAALFVSDAAASEHAGHMDGVHQQHDMSNSSCATQDECNGQCCTGCTHSFTGASLLLMGDDHTRSVMTPAVPHLAASSPSFARERPPRLFSL